MALRWQGVGELAHALDTDHRPRAYERFRAVCGRWCEVWPGDVLRGACRWKFWGGPGWLAVPPRCPCADCDRIWADIRGLSRSQARMDSAT